MPNREPIAFIDTIRPLAIAPLAGLAVLVCASLNTLSQAGPAIPLYILVMVPFVYGTAILFVLPTFAIYSPLRRPSYPVAAIWGALAAIGAISFIRHSIQPHGGTVYVLIVFGAAGASSGLLYSRLVRQRPDIQNAAIASEHGNRDLPNASFPIPIPRPRSGAADVLVVLGAVAGLCGLLIAARVSQSTAASPCALHTLAVIVLRDTPIARAAGWTSDTLVIRNLDPANWNDVTVTVYGFEDIGGVGVPTSPYRAKKAGSSSDRLLTFGLNDLQNESGEHWSSSRIKVEGAFLQASISGQACQADLRLDATPMDMIGQ